MNTEKVLKLMYLLYKNSANNGPAMGENDEEYGINLEIHNLVLEIFPTPEGRNNFNNLVEAQDGQFYLRNPEISFVEFKTLVYGK